MFCSYSNLRNCKEHRNELLTILKAHYSQLFTVSVCGPRKDEILHYKHGIEILYHYKKTLLKLSF
jgi:hypothetical protein